MSTKDTPTIPCAVCKKKSIYNMKCRCNEHVCTRHREPAKHACAFDYTGHQNKLNKDILIKIESQKIEAI